MSILWFIVIFIIVIYAITWMFTKTKTLSNYSISSTTTTFEAAALSNPSSKNYSYSIWIYISSWTNTDTPKYIFSRCAGSEGSQICFPEVSLAETDNTLNVRVSSDKDGDTVCSIPNIPIQTWTNIIVSLNTKVLDVYINGKLSKTCITSGVPAFNKDAGLVLTPAPSFTGYTSRFIFYANPTGPEDAWTIYKSGPGGNLLMSFLNQYKIKLSFLKGTEETASITI
jgi:hypothetical protein